MTFIVVQLWNEKSDIRDAALEESWLYAGGRNENMDDLEPDLGRNIEPGVDNSFSVPEFSPGLPAVPMITSSPGEVLNSWLEVVTSHWII